jgi:nitrite reductase/ring-hydroxylating ferredoxin subunit
MPKATWQAGRKLNIKVIWVSEQLSASDQVSNKGDLAPWSERLCNTADLPQDGESIVFEIADRRIAIFSVSGSFYAVDDFCTHAQSSLSQDGIRCDLVVECALHRAQFSLETGKALRGPTRKPLRRYELEICGDEVTATQCALAEIRRPPSAM